MTSDDLETIKRPSRLRQIMNEFLRTMTPQDRDRRMQIHLAQARGPVQNARLLCQAMDFSLRLRAQRREESGNGG